MDYIFVIAWQIYMLWNFILFFSILLTNFFDTI